MNFIGMDMYGDANVWPIFGGTPSLSCVTIENGIYDDVYLTRSIDSYTTNNMEWTSDTLLFAKFDKKNLSASNFDYGEDLQSLQLKRHEIGKPWILLFERTINNSNDINFSYVDNFARGRDTEYEYALVPVLKNGQELPYIRTTIKSKFYGAVIADGTKSYHVLLDPEVTETNRNRQASVVTTLNSKYPFVFIGGESNYTSGSFSGTAIEYLGNDVFDIDHNQWYREEMFDWLTNGEPKILKIEDGRAWMIVVSSDIKDNRSEHPDKVSISFDFTEVGDINDNDDMYNNGLTNINTSISATEVYTVVNNLLYTTTSNTTLTVNSGDSYTAVLAPQTNYKVSGAVVMMGGVNITNTAYNSATRTIHIENVTANVVITASSVRIRTAATTIYLRDMEITVYVGNTYLLEPTITPDAAMNNAVTWRSSDEAIAKVKDGVVTGVAEGTASIFACVDGLIATCKVTVKK